MKKVLAALVMSASIAGAALAEGNVEAGRVLSQTCIGCHGVPHYVNPYPTYYVPYIGGQNAPYIESALREYRSGEREHETMRANAALLSDQDITDIAAYISSL